MKVRWAQVVGSVRVPFAVWASALLLAAGCAQILYGEVIPVSSGLGWDGLFYARAATDLPGVLGDPGLDSYRFRRLLPSAVVYGVLEFLAKFQVTPQARTVFAWMNLALQLVALLAWAGITRRLHVAEGGRWLGFILLFVNFANLKMPFYYSVLTDSTALALGALLLYFHLARSRLGSMLTLLAGGFTWPSFMLFGAPLLVWPPRGEESPPEATDGAWPTTVALVAGLAFVALAIAFGPEEGTRLHLLGVVVAAAYLFRTSKDLLGHAAVAPAILWRRIDWIGVAGMATLALGVSLVVVALSGPTAFTMAYFLRLVVRYSSIHPGLFLVARAAYFGLIVPVLIVLWRHSVAATHGLGAGLTLYVLVHMAWGIHPESRSSIDALPAFTLIAVLAVSRWQWPKPTVFVAGGLAVVFSKAWLTINRGEVIGWSDPASYPAQLYFMNHGPWMARENWALQGMILAATCALIWLTVRRLQPAADAATSIPLPASARKWWMTTAGALLLTGLGELAGRMYMRQERREVISAIRAAPTVGWEHIPGGEMHVRTSEFVNTVRFNRQGFRGDEIPVSRRSGARRILLLGDAFLEGYPLADDATVGGALARTLSSREPTEVLNTGVTGYSTAQESLLFRCHVHAYSPDVVVVFFRGDDLAETADDGAADCPEGLAPRMDTRAEANAVRPFDTRPFRGSVMWRAMGNAAARHHPRLHDHLLSLGLAERSDPRRALRAYGPVREGRDWWAATEYALRRLQASMEPAAKLVVLYVPEAFEVDDAAWAQLQRQYRIGRRWSRTKVFDTLQEVCARLQVPLVDPRAALSASAQPTYYGREGVWNAQGHAVAAGQLAAALEDAAVTNSTAPPSRP